MVLTRRSCGGRFEPISLSTTPVAKKKLQRPKTDVKDNSTNSKKCDNDADSTPTRRKGTLTTPNSGQISRGGVRTPIRTSNKNSKKEIPDDKNENTITDNRLIADIAEHLNLETDRTAVNKSKSPQATNLLEEINEEKDALGYFIDKGANKADDEIDVLEYVIDTTPHQLMNKSSNDLNKDSSNDDNESAAEDSDDDDDELIDHNGADIGFYIDKTPARSQNKESEESDQDEDSDSSIVDESESDSGQIPSVLDNLLPFTSKDLQMKTDEASSASRKKKNSKTKNEKSKWTLASSLQPGVKVSSYIESRSTTDQLATVTKLKQNNNDDEILKKSVIKPGFEKLDCVPQYEESIRKSKKERKEQRKKTMGPKWYDMKAPEMTEELKNDLEVVKMRKALNPKRFYKNNDLDAVPKFFQMGEVVETAADFYHARVPKKQRKATVVDELLADAEFRKFNKRKFIEVQERDHRFKRSRRGGHKHSKKSKKKT